MSIGKLLFASMLEIFLKRLKIFEAGALRRGAVSAPSAQWPLTHCAGAQ